ncbi:MAG TPA: carboxypeptidase-like regulatory domain-containing protein [Bryobacteraceae bacterium]|nr:carboxypeptidase-like regulatory domain-containing protein [Bryobacteraceae bacterium]
MHTSISSVHRGILLPALAAVLFAGSLWGQSAELSGRITDPSGEIINGAKVTLTQQATMLQTGTQSNESGYYFFPRGQPGVYRLVISHQGFKAVERSGINMAPADRRRVDVQLELGSVAETINVMADASQLQADSAEVSTTVTSREFAQLPQIQYNRMRSPANFTYLSPGVHGNVATNGRETVAASNNIRINDSRSTSNEIYMDGMPGRTNFNETAPPVDAIGEFKLQANQLSAEYGNTGSAVITFSVKSGTNNFHGLLSNIFRNEKLDARSFLSPNRSTIRQNEFGGTFGGPVTIPKLYDGKNRTFFFFSYTGSRKRGLDQTQRLRVPSLAEREGDYSANPRLIYDPATTRSNGTVYVRDPFAGNWIPASRFDAAAAKVTSLLPSPNLSGAGLLNYTDSIGERLLDPNVYLVRLDHAFSEKHRVFCTYNHTYIPRQNQTAAMADPWSDRTLQNISSHMVRANWLGRRAGPEERGGRRFPLLHLRRLLFSAGPQ